MRIAIHVILWPFAAFSFIVGYVALFLIVDVLMNPTMQATLSFGPLKPVQAVAPDPEWAKRPNGWSEKTAIWI